MYFLCWLKVIFLLILVQELKCCMDLLDYFYYFVGVLQNELFKVNYFYPTSQHSIFLCYHLLIIDHASSIKINFCKMLIECSCLYIYYMVYFSNNLSMLHSIKDISHILFTKIELKVILLNFNWYWSYMNQ